MALIDKKSLYDLVPGDGNVGQMDALSGPEFGNNTQDSIIQVNNLTGLYESSMHNINYNASTLDLNGVEGPAFVNNPESNIHTDSLDSIYESSIHNINYLPSTTDLNGVDGPNFMTPYQTKAASTGLAGVYKSSVHQIAYQMTGYDLDGTTPPKYENSLPEGLGTLPG